MANTHFNKITAQFADRKSAMAFANFITKKVESQEDLFEALLPMPKSIPEEMQENWIEKNWGAYYDECFKLEWIDWATNTIVLRFNTVVYGCPKEMVDFLAKKYENTRFMLEHFCPEENWLCRYVWNGYDANPFDVKIDDLTAEQAALIDDLDEYGLNWDITSKRDNGKYCFHIEYDSFGEFEFSIRHYEGEFNPWYGNAQKLVIEHIKKIVWDNFNEAYKHYMNLLEGVEEEVKK